MQLLSQLIVCLTLTLQTTAVTSTHQAVQQGQDSLLALAGQLPTLRCHRLWLQERAIANLDQGRINSLQLLVGEISGSIQFGEEPHVKLKDNHCSETPDISVSRPLW